MIRSAPVNVFDYLTEAQRTTVLAYSFATDVTAACQSALNDARANNLNCYFPAGGYLVTGLTIPGDVNPPVDDRDSGIRIYGQSTGEGFVHTNTGGTVIKSVTNAPVLTDILGTVSSSNGTIEIDHIEFDGTSNGFPVIKLQSFYGVSSSFHHNSIYQRGDGDGFVTGWGAGFDVHNNWCMNSDWNSYSLGAARTGIGFSYVPTADNGLVTFTKNSSRGWLTAYNIAGGAGVAFSACIDKCESAVSYNGIILQSNAEKCIVSDCYFEGGDGGIGINNLGDYNTIRDNLMFAGYAVGIQDLSTSNIGTLIEGNVIGLAANANSKGISVQSSAAFGGYNKNIVNNSIAFTDGTAGVKGIQLTGDDPRVTILGNAFDPRGAWTGAATVKIDDQSANSGPFGIITQENGAYEIPVLAGGALSLFSSAAALTETDVAATILTIPNGSYFPVTATSATTVNRFSAGNLAGRVVVFRTTNANMTFADTSYNQLAGGVSFTGPGTITFYIDKIASDNYAYEIARTVF
jgi:hypothetical protein